MTRVRRVDGPVRGRRAPDLSLRLEQQVAQKPVSVSGSNMPPTIVVDDDDDDVCISSPRSFNQARSAGTSSRQRSRASVVENRASSTEDLLELRLGPNPCELPFRPTSVKIRVPHQRNGASSTTREHRGKFMIDLTSPSPPYDADCILVNEFVQKKRKPVQPAHELVPPEPAKELKLTCAICMDAMKEETSTTCGHIFCRKCILGAIQAQKKCPTCRQKLTNNLIHRIYISGSLRNP